MNKKIIILILLAGIILSGCKLTGFAIFDNMDDEILDSFSKKSVDETNEINMTKGQEVETMSAMVAQLNKITLPEFVPGEIIVKFRQNPDLKQSTQLQILAGQPDIATNMASINSLNKKFKVIDFRKIFKATGKPKKEKVPDLSNIYKFKVPEEADIQEIVKEYQSDPSVVWAEPNYIGYDDTVPNDDDYSLQWAHKNMQSELAWDIETGSEDVIIAVIDSGVDYNHSDLMANIWNNTDEIPGNMIDDDGNSYTDDIRGWDFRNNDNDPMDDRGHGTHVAGIAAALSNNSIGITGMCWNCKIMPLKVSDPAGQWTTAVCANAITYAADNNASVISMSLTSWGAQVLKEALDYAYSQGVVIVASAGNDDANYVRYPAGYENVISVAATDANDERASFSNYGAWIDIAAPGTSIYSTVPTGSCVFCHHSGYGYMSGTSMSAPYISGLVGLILSKNSNFTQENIRNILKSNIDNVSSFLYLGAGRANAYKTLQINNVTAFANITYPITHELNLGRFTTFEIIKNNTNITGTTIGNYTVYYGAGFYPTNWTEIGSGSNITNDVLALWNISSLVDGVYTIKLIATDENGSVMDSVPVEVGKNFQSGWPVRVSGDVVSSVLGDIDADGDIEVTSGYGPSVASFFSNGTQMTDFGLIDLRFPIPSLGDLDGDGDLEIVVGSYHSGKMYAYHHNGSAVEGWPVNLTISTLIPEYVSPALGDIDGDADLEIVVNEKYKVSALHHNGSNVTDWPIITAWTRSSPAIGDLDNDGDLEIVTGTYHKVYLWHHNGTNESGWPIDMISYGDYSDIIGSSPVLGDIDYDGEPEIVIGSERNMYAWYSNGTLVEGWPISMNDSVIYSTPALGDIDGDFDLEIALGARNNQIYLWHHNGSTFNGWPINISPDKVMDYTSPVLGDIDGDGDIEIMVSSEGGRIYAWHHNGSVVNGFPIQAVDKIQTTPSLGDIDKDGDIEIIIGTNENLVYIYDLNATYNPNNIEWGMFQNNMAHTGLYTYPKSSKLNIWDETDIGMHYANLTKYPNENITFFANYTNATSNTIILGANCNISIQTIGNATMILNATKQLYEYYLQEGFVSSGTYNWNVTCEAMGYDSLTALNTVTINKINTAPEFNLSNPIQNVTWLEDNSDSSINLTYHFYDPDGDILIYNYSSVENITVQINQITGIVTLIPDANFTGVRHIRFNAIDGLLWSDYSNNVMLNVTSVNDAPTLISIKLSLTLVKNGTLITITTINSSDVELDNITLMCRNESGIYNLCNSTAGQPERNCSFNASWTDDVEHYVYCIINDGINNSIERNASITADNTPPNISDLSVTPTIADVGQLINISANVTDANNVSSVTALVHDDVAYEIALNITTITITDILEQGQVKTYTLVEQDYEVEVTFIGTIGGILKVRFRINGALIDTLAEGKTFELVDGTIITIINITEEEEGEVTADQVEFMLSKSTAPNYLGTWNTSNATEGTYLVDINATDVAGNTRSVKNIAVIGLSSAAENTYTNNTVSILENETTVISSNETGVELEISTTTNVTNASIHIVKYSENIETTNFGVLELDIYVDIVVDDEIENNLDWAIIKVYYTDAEVAAAGIDEVTLKIYYYNESSGSWQLEPTQGVNIVANYVWANTTHLSLFGIFGSAPPAPAPTPAPSRARPSCPPIWDCTEWSECSLEGIQTRFCIDMGSCKFGNRTQKRSCEYVPTCYDGIQNQDETDIDCGGSICPKCKDDKRCKTDGDCINKCNITTHRCYTPVIEKPPLPEKPVVPVVTKPVIEKRLIGLVLFIIIAAIFVLGGIYPYGVRVVERARMREFNKTLAEAYTLIKAKNIDALKAKYDLLKTIYEKLSIEDKSKAYKKIIHLHSKIKKIILKKKHAE